LTPEQHNKYLGIAHLAYAALLFLLVVGFLTMFGVMFAAMGNQPVRAGEPAPPPPAFFLIVGLFFAALYGAFLVPSFVAGYALLKRKRWAKIAAIIAGVVASMFAPFGTALCVYTLWFLFSEPGRLLYDTPATTLPPLPRFGGAPDSIGQRDMQHADYGKLPDWR
jgi:hypothetical protein